MSDNSRARIPLLVDGSKPCGYECQPFNDQYCLLFGDEDAAEVRRVMEATGDPELVRSIAQIACRGIERQNELRDEAVANHAEARFWKQIAFELSTDQHTGLLTGNSLPLLLESLYESGLAAEYRSQGFKIRLLYADVDNLKGHNSGPGKHSQGDVALSAAGLKIGNHSGRNMDITALGEGFIDEFIVGPSQINSRSNDKGDEFVRISFIDPKDTNRTETVEEELERLKNELADITYEYGGIQYAVTLTFGIAEIDIPADVRDLTSCLRAVDAGMMEFKESRHKVVSDGIIVKIG
jgi:GGDEF domain-containing protein